MASPLRPSPDGLATSKSQWAYRTVRAMILSGELAPGSYLDQQALAGQLGISTTPLREGLRRLESEDYIVRRDHRDIRIAEVSLAKMIEIYAVRVVLDPLAARLACRRMSRAQVRAVTELLPPAEGLSKMGYLAQNRAFHHTIYASSGNEALTRILDSLWDQSDRYRSGVLDDPDVAARARAEHAEMCGLLEARDADGLAALMRAHLEGSLEHCRREADAQIANPVGLAIVPNDGTSGP